MRVLRAHDGATSKNHLVLGERACLVGEDVLNLSQVLCNVQSFTLYSAVCLLIIKVYVIRDEENLANLHQLNGNIEGDWDQDLEEGKTQHENPVSGGFRDKSRGEILFQPATG